MGVCEARVCQVGCLLRQGLVRRLTSHHSRSPRRMGIGALCLVNFQLSVEGPEARESIYKHTTCERSLLSVRNWKRTFSNGVIYGTF
jgi:hypothetical protein